MAEYTYSEPVAGVYAVPYHEVRYLLGDTTPAAPFSLSDAELAYELAKVANVTRFAAANVAFKMAGRYSLQSVTSKSVGDVHIARDYSRVAGYYRVLSLQLRSNHDLGYIAGPIFTGGITADDAQFTLGQHDKTS